MDKEKFISVVAARSGITKVLASSVVDAVIDTVTDALASGESVKFVGFGTFEIKERHERVGRNVYANKPVFIPATKVPHFTPGKGLKDRISANGGTGV